MHDKFERNQFRNITLLHLCLSLRDNQSSTGELVSETLYMFSQSIFIRLL
jgi:hypothetical protein